jgi:hypothetical protein
LAIRVPRLSFEDLRGHADRFLTAQHPSGTVPVPIEGIVEFGLGINIIPLPGLHADHGIDGFLSADMTEISVDLYVFESRPARYRFTLAHEIAHLVLHGDTLKKAIPATAADWRAFVRDLSEADREWLEYQAYAFAGLVLVPRESLQREYRMARRRADEAGINVEQFPDIAKQYMATMIARVFEVSPAVIEKRLAKDCV